MIENYIDNEGLVERINKQRLYPLDYSHKMLEPDWDVISNLLQSRPSIQHIKAYQKDDIAHENITFQAQLNIAAD
eukprot:11028556-Ditylum_brightwellii.AAC.1